MSNNDSTNQNEITINIWSNEEVILSNQTCGADTV